MMDLALEIPPPTGLAIAYVPSSFRSAFSLLLQIDARFDLILHKSREPMIAQIKMAWWREAFGKAPLLRPKGEPLLQLLTDSGDLISSTALEALVLAWEVLLGSETWNQDVVERHANLRANAIFQTYADWVGSTQDIKPMGQLWAIEALRHGFPQRLSSSIAAPSVVLPRARALRPLSILTMSVQNPSGPRLVWHALTGL